MTLRIATFNLENLDEQPEDVPTLAERLAIMRPQMARLRADIVCLQEVNGQGAPSMRSLAALDHLIVGTPYALYHRQYTTTTTGQLYNERNLVVLSRQPFTGPARIIREGDAARPSYQMATAVPPDSKADPVSWERPLLYSRIDLGPAGHLHLINVHLKSKLASDIPGGKINNHTWRSVSAWAEGSFISSMKRMGQALQVRQLVDSIFDQYGEQALIAVCGDFNAETDEVPIRCIVGPVEETGNPAHAPRVLVPCDNSIAESSRHSLLHLGKGYMIDHIIVSRGMLQYFKHCEVHNEALPDESGAFRTDRQFPESDHAPVVAQFDLGASLH